MKIRLKYTLIGLPVALVLALLIGVAWLFETAEGARWFFAQVSRSTELHIQAKSLEGTLARGVRIQRLTIALPDTAVEIKEFTLRWRPAELLFGRISMQELSATEVRVRDDRPQTTDAGPPTLTWPSPGGLFRRISIRVNRLDIQDLAYQRAGTEPVIVNRFSSEIALSHGALSLRTFLLRTPQVQIDGVAIAGFIRPSLRVDVAIIPSEPIASLDHFTIATNLSGNRNENTLTGPIEITGLSQREKKIYLAARLETSANAFRVNDLHLSRPGHEGVLTGQADVLLSGKLPVIDATVAAENADLSDLAPYLTGISGRLRISGTTSSYHGKFALSKKGTGLQSGSLEANFTGTAGELALKSLHGNWLGASIDGAAGTSWEKTRAEASLKVRNLDPSNVSPEWNGSINMDLTGAVRFKNKRPSANVSVRLLPSRLRDQDLSGAVKANLEGENIRIERLALRGTGFAVKAHGGLGEKIDFDLRFSDLSLLVPDSEGDVSLTGWVRRKNNAISGALIGQGKNILLSGARASVVNLSASIKNSDGYPFTISLALGDASYSMVRADRVSLDASGTLAEHRFDAVLHSAEYSMSARVTGGYAQGVWKGTIVKLAGTEQKGQLVMQSPADVMISQNRFSLSPILLKASGDQRIELSGNFTKEPLSGALTARWTKIDISRANAWLNGITVSGLSEGNITATVLRDARLAVNGRASLSGANLRRTFEQGELKADIDRADLTVLWHEDSLVGNLAVSFAKYGRFDAGITGVLPARLPVAFNGDGAIKAFVKGQLRESGTLSFLFPGLVQESRGQVNVDVRVSGTWNNPQLAGGFDLEQAGGYFPAAGIHVSDVQMKALISRDRIMIETMKAKSGNGKIEGKAVVTLSGWTVEQYKGSLQGDKFQALYLPQTRMLISPKITFEGTQEKLSVRGEVKVPELLIYGPPKEAAVQPSEDVVIVSEQRKAEAAGELAMDIEVKVILGERVIVKAAGADAQLEGEVMLTIRTLQEVRGRGEITVKKGKYSTYGVGLDIERGRILFAGGPVENPGLDILAVKTVNDVKAGVIVTGTLKKPMVKLYSQPAMPDADVLAYMVLGHPLGQDKEQSSYVMQAAGALLSASQSVALQDQVKQRLGLDTIDVESGAGNVSRSLVTIGKYLSSKLYVSYGRELFTGENLFRLRYKFAKRWELESHSGETSGVDLYYTIQFD